MFFYWGGLDREQERFRFEGDSLTCVDWQGKMRDIRRCSVRNLRGIFMGLRMFSNNH